MKRTVLNSPTLAAALRFARSHSAALGWSYLALITLLGIGWRLKVAIDNRYFPNAEAGNVARALAQGSGFADAFYVGQGATAHILPVTPLIAGSFYAVFGQGWSGQSMLAGWAILITAVTYLLAALCLRIAGASAKTCLLGLTLLWLVPINDFTEAVRWQVWDGGLSTMLALACLTVVLWGEKMRASRAGHWLFKAALPALAFITNPIAGLAAGAVSGLSIMRCRRRDGMVKPVVRALMCVALVVTPWAVHNQIALHHFVPLRDNLGLELALANHTSAVDPVSAAGALTRRSEEIHPYGHPDAQMAMREAGGEIAYSQLLLRNTIEWIVDHPTETAAIWTRHLSEYVFPRAWMYALEHEAFPRGRSWIDRAISVLAFISLIAAAMRREMTYLYFALFTSVPMLLVLPFQPVMRYCWITYPLFACFAADSITRSLRPLSGSWSPSASRTYAELDVVRDSRLP